MVTPLNLLLGLSLIPWTVVCFFAVFKIPSYPVYGTAFAFLIYLYPVVTILSIVLSFFIRKQLYSTIPISLLLAGFVCLLGYAFLHQSKEKTLQNKDDVEFTQHELDGFLSVALPKSFEQYEKELISDHFYYLDISGPGQSSHTYSFNRGVYKDVGGVHVGSSFGIEVYKSTETLPTLVDEHYAYMIHSRASLDRARTEISPGIFKGEVPYLKDTNILVYTNEREHYRAYLLYAKDSLSDSVAVDMFKQAISSIKITDTLENRIEMFEKDFYLKNPDKRPVEKN